MTTLKKTLNRFARKRRIRAKITGSHENPRLNVYRSLGNNYAQLIDDAQGVTLISVSDLKDASIKGTRTEKAKQVGLKLAALAKEKKIAACTFDRNGYKYHGRVKALAEGAREGGLKF